MPIYEYRCSDCSHYFDRLQKISDPVLTTCPICGHNSLKKLISAAGFHLKGTGWYVTDFKTPISPNTSFSTSTESVPNIEKVPKLT